MDEQLRAQEAAAEAAQREYEGLNRQFEQEGLALAQLLAALPGAEAEATAAKRAYGVYAGLITTRLAAPCPADEATFEQLRGQLPGIRDAATAALPDAEQKRSTALKRYADTAHEHEQTKAELIALQSASNLIPADHARRRDRIAMGAGVPPADLPYAAELIDVADGEERWRPAAAEKVVRSFGLRLLVPERHKDAVRRYVDENDMRAVVEYGIVTSVSAHRPTPKPDTLAAKLTVDLEHPCGQWLAVQVANRFDHVCVETARDLEPHRLAVTLRGTVKMAGNHYRKDDRPEVVNPSSYILGANTVAKRVALQAEVDRLAQQVKRDHTAADAADTELRNLQTRIDAVGQLLDYTFWAEIDHAGAARRVHGIREQIEAIKADNVNLRELEDRKDRAFTDWKAKLQASGNTKRDIEDAGRRQTKLVDLLAEEQRKPHQITDEEHLEYLDKVLAAVDAPDQSDDMPRLRTAFRKELDHRRREADGERSRAEAKIKTAIDQFVRQWPDTAPDTTGEVDRCGQDYVALYEDIIQRRLHEAMEKFKHIISEDMVPSIAVLQRAIETSTSQIKDRIAMVNDALNRAQFNPGTSKTLPGKARQAARWRPDPTRLHDPAQAARTALRSIARRIHTLGEEIDTLDAQLSTLVRVVAPRTLALPGIATVNAARMLVAAGQNINRLTSEAAFAHLCGAAPIPASSGKIERHRLNPGGNRDANCTLHMIAVVRLRCSQSTRDYATRRTAEGKSKKEIIRCLKRYIARQIYYTLRADLKNLAQALDAI